MSYNPQNPNGQATSANSAPAVIASDQPSFPINLEGQNAPYWPSYGAPDSVGSKETVIDAGGALVVRSAVLTDEGTYRVNFANSSLAVSIGTITDITGDIVTGSGFSSVDVHLKDYFKLDADPESAWIQIASIDSDTQITLYGDYVGGTSGAGSRSLIKPTTGAGGSITVASGQCIMTSGTTSGEKTILNRSVDYAPLVFNKRVSVSQRVANQNIRIGFAEGVPSPRWFARFRLEGTDANTIVRCETARNPTTTPSVAETETVTITIPQALTTASLLDYRIEMLVDVCRFYIQGFLVAENYKSLPAPFDFMASGTLIENTGVPASSTTVTVDFMTTKNHNKLEMGVMSNNEKIDVRPIPSSPFNFSQAGVIPINTDLLVIDCLQYRSVSFQLTAIGTTGVISFFSTNDLSVTGTASIANPVGGGAGVTTTNAAGMWNIVVTSRYLRVRLTTATTAGTTTIFALASIFSLPPALSVTQATAAALNTTVSGSLTTVATVTTLANGQTASSSASTGNPLRIGGRVAPTAISTQDTTLVAGDASEVAITTAMQQVVKPFAASELDISLPVLPSVTATTIQSIMAASGTASVRNYIDGITIQTDTLGAAGNMFFLDNQGAIGTAVNTGTGVFTNSGTNDLRVGDAIIFTNLGTITGAVTNTIYYVTATTLATTTFVISATPGGATLTITGTTSAFTFYRVFYMFRLNTAALTTPFVFKPTQPWRSVANSNMNVYFPTSLVSGVIYLDINGYRGF